jgi:hypothetical protein
VVDKVSWEATKPSDNGAEVRFWEDIHNSQGALSSGVPRAGNKVGEGARVWLASSQAGGLVGDNNYLSPLPGFGKSFDDADKRVEQIGKGISEGDLDPLKRAVAEAQYNPDVRIMMKHVVQSFRDAGASARYVFNAKDERMSHFEISLPRDGDLPKQALWIGADGTLLLNHTPVTDNQDVDGNTGNGNMDTFIARLQGDADDPNVENDDGQTALSGEMKKRLASIEQHLGRGDMSNLQKTVFEIAGLQASADPKKRARANELQRVLGMVADNWTIGDSVDGEPPPVYANYDPAKNSFKFGLNLGTRNKTWSLDVTSTGEVLFFDRSSEGKGKVSFPDEFEKWSRMRLLIQQYIREDLKGSIRRI